MTETISRNTGYELADSNEYERPKLVRVAYESVSPEMFHGFIRKSLRVREPATDDRPDISYTGLKAILENFQGLDSEYVPYVYDLTYDHKTNVLSVEILAASEDQLRRDKAIVDSEVYYARELVGSSPANTVDF